MSGGTGPAPERVAIGELFADRYLVGATLGQGGMGTVYEARDCAAVERCAGAARPMREERCAGAARPMREERGAGAARPVHDAAVALKILHPELARDAVMRRRFAREAAILRQLDHPGIVRVTDVGCDPYGRVFSVMDRVRGQTLADRLEVGPMPAAELAPRLVALGRALDAAHADGVLHGDLKPQNVFFAGERGVVLVDFGASKVFGLERLTATGQLAGTPAYLAPEVVRGDRALDRRLDVYALGVVAYEALAGRRPFEGPSLGRLLASILAGAPAPLTARAGVPEPVAACVHTALAARPGARFPSAGAFARAFENALLGG